MDVYNKMTYNEGVSAVQYCPRCQRLCAAKCPSCGKTRGLRSPEPDDPVLLVEADAMQALLIEPILEEAGIPCSRMGRMGAGITACIGTALETFSFFVPFAAYEDGRALLDSVFGPESDIVCALHKNDTQGE